MDFFSLFLNSFFDEAFMYVLYSILLINSCFFFFQIRAAHTRIPSLALYSLLKTTMDWNHLSFILGRVSMPYMAAVVMAQHSVDTIFTSQTLQATTRIPSPTWVTVMCSWPATGTVQVTREVCWPEVTISSLMKLKCFIRLTKANISLSILDAKSSKEEIQMVEVVN